MSRAGRGVYRRRDRRSLPGARIALVAAAVLAADGAVVAHRHGGGGVDPTCLNESSPHPAKAVVLGSAFPVPAVSVALGDLVRVRLPSGAGARTAPVASDPTILCVVGGSADPAKRAEFFARARGTAVVHVSEPTPSVAPTGTASPSAHPGLAAVVTVH